MPAYVSVLGRLLRVDRNLHSVVEKTVRLRKIDDREFDSVTCCCISYSKIKPLSVALGVDIILH